LGAALFAMIAASVLTACASPVDLSALPNPFAGPDPVPFDKPIAWDGSQFVINLDQGPDRLRHWASADGLNWTRPRRASGPTASRATG